MKNLKLAKLHRVISNFKKAKILVIGDIMLDKFIWGTVSRISPEAPVPVVWAKTESYMPGGASNVANNIRSAGGSAYICGVVGDDEEGRVLISELSRNNINSDGIVVDGSRPTVNKTRIIAHHQQVVRIDKEPDRTVSNNIISDILSYASKKIPGVDAVIIEDYGKGLIVPRLIKALIRYTRGHKKIIVVDPKSDYLTLYKGVTAIKPNRKEAEMASGIKIKDITSLEKAGKKMLRRLNAETVLITLGEDGMAMFQDGGRLVHIPTVAQEVYDVSGAGDTAIAIFTMARLSGATTIEAAHMANIAAGVVVGKLGIAVCSSSELKTRISQIKKHGLSSKRRSYPSDSVFCEEGKESINE